MRGPIPIHFGRRAGAVEEEHDERVTHAAIAAIPQEHSQNASGRARARPAANYDGGVKANGRCASGDRQATWPANLVSFRCATGA